MWMRAFLRSMHSIANGLIGDVINPPPPPSSKYTNKLIMRSPGPPPYSCRPAPTRPACLRAGRRRRRSMAARRRRGAPARRFRSSPFVQTVTAPHSRHGSTEGAAAHVGARIPPFTHMASEWVCSNRNRTYSTCLLASLSTHRDQRAPAACAAAA